MRLVSPDRRTDPLGSEMTPKQRTTTEKVSDDAQIFRKRRNGVVYCKMDVVQIWKNKKKTGGKKTTSNYSTRYLLPPTVA